MNSYPVKAYLSKERFELASAFSIAQGHQLIKRESDFALLQVGETAYIYLKRFGAIVFFNVDPSKESDYLKDYCPKETALFERSESMSFIVDPEIELPVKSSFDTISIPLLDEEIVHTICLNLAQSVAIFAYQIQADELLNRTKSITLELESAGTVSMSRKKLLKFLGKSHNLKSRIAENLFIFNTPQVAWDHESSNQLDAKLNEYLEIKSRYTSIKESLDITQDSLDLFKDVLLHKHSSFLEWIIILLILFEILHVLFEKIF